MGLKTLDLKDKQFTCGGRTFFVEDSLSFNRYRELQRLSIEFGFSRTFIDLFKDVQKCYDLMQTSKNYADVSVTLYNILAGVGQIEEKDPAALRLCALFINEKDEDTTVVNEIKMKEKIDCWSKELEVSPFFHLAASLVDGWMPAYRLITRNTLKKESEKE